VAPGRGRGPWQGGTRRAGAQGALPAPPPTVRRPARPRCSPRPRHAACACALERRGWGKAGKGTEGGEHGARRSCVLAVPATWGGEPAQGGSGSLLLRHVRLYGCRLAQRPANACQYAGPASKRGAPVHAGRAPPQQARPVRKVADGEGAAGRGVGPLRAGAVDRPPVVPRHVPQRHGPCTQGLFSGTSAMHGGQTCEEHAAALEMHTALVACNKAVWGCEQGEVPHRFNDGQEGGMSGGVQPVIRFPDSAPSKRSKHQQHHSLAK
jgi:hypothetical protein